MRYKKLFKAVLFIFLILFSITLSANEIKPKPTIKEVIVYLSGAQISSEVMVTVPKGNSKIILSDLSPKINSNSIQVSGLQDVNIVSVNYNINFLEKKIESDKIVALEKSLADRNREVAVLRNKIRGLDEEESLLSINKKIHTEQQSASIEKVATYSKYYRERTEQIKTTVYDTNKQIEKLNETISDLQKEINKLKSNHTTQRGEIVLTLDAPVSKNLTLQLKYNVSDAGWFPTYDLKAKNTQSPVNLFYKANVYQETGEDWNNVKVTLSTGDPTFNTEKPNVEPHFLNFVNSRTFRPQPGRTNTANLKYNPTVRRVSGTITDETGMPLPGVNVVLKGTAKGTQADFDGNYSLEINQAKEIQFSYLGYITETVPIYANTINMSMFPDANELEEVVVTAYGRKRAKNDLQGAVSGIVIEEEIPFIEREENITNVLFKINKNYTIPTSKTELTTIEINTFEIPAEYEYYTAPLISQNVFLTAKLKEWENLDILSGEANIYFDGSFAGTTFLSPMQTEETLVISLGIDPGIVVERKQINDMKDKSFFGNNRIIKRNYEISLRNNKSQAVEITLIDRIPIAQNKEIKVENPNFGNASFEEKTGIVTWKVVLNAKQSEKREISYEVRYPKDKYINLN